MERLIKLDEFDKSTMAENHQGFNKESFARLYKVEENNFWFRSRNRLVIEILRKFLSGSEKYMEIGCGTGFVLRGVTNAFPSLNAIGTDYYSQGLEFANMRIANSNVKLIQMDARKMPFEKEFDMIAAYDVIEHIKEDRLALKQINKSLKPNGHVVITVPQHRWMWSDIDSKSYHHRRYSRKELIKKLANSGFKVEYWTSFVSILLPLMALSRFFSQRNRNDKTRDELALPRAVDSLFELIMFIELILIRFLSGRLPFGGSLLVVEKKLIA